MLSHSSFRVVHVFALHKKILPHRCLQNLLDVSRLEAVRYSIANFALPSKLTMNPTKFICVSLNLSVSVSVCDTAVAR